MPHRIHHASADVLDAVAACSCAVVAERPDTLRALLLEDALGSLLRAERMLADCRRLQALDELFTALGLLNDAIDAAGVLPDDDPVLGALDAATHALAATARA